MGCSRGDWRAVTFLVVTCPLLHLGRNGICSSVLLLGQPVSIMTGTGYGGLIASYGYWELDVSSKSGLKLSNHFAADLIAVFLN